MLFRIEFERGSRKRVAAAAAAGGGALYAASRIMTPGLDFDEGMSGVQALTRLDKNDPRLKMLRDQARELGASTAYTATDVASGQKFLAMAGFTPEAIKAALPGVLNMGLAGDMDLGEASDIGSNVLTQFKLDADQMNRVSDVLTATFTRSNTDLRMLGETMTYAGPVAAQLGVSLESMAAMAGTMADNGIRGSMAGTSLRAGLSRLVAPVGKGQAAMSALGVSIKDANGQLRDSGEILKDVGKTLRKYDQASQIRIKKDIFGEEAMVGMGAVIDATLNGRYDELLKSNQGAGGEADKNAKVKIDNLKGDFKQLQSAWEDLGIQMQESVDSPLRNLTQGLTGVVTSIGKWMQAHPQLTSMLIKAGLIIAGLTAVLGTLAVGAAAVMLPFAAMRLSLSLLTGGQGLLGAQGAFSNFFNVIKVGSGMARFALSTMFGPIGLVVTALVIAALTIYKYWDYISAFFSGFFEGLMIGLAPIREAFSGAFSVVAPIFDAIWTAVKKVWEWLSELFAPIKASDEALKDCTDAGKTFGEVVGFAISALMTPITMVAKGINWILEALGMAPQVASDTVNQINKMKPVELTAETKAVMDSFNSPLQSIAAVIQAGNQEQAKTNKETEKHNDDVAKGNITPPKVKTPDFGTAVYDPGEAKSKTKGSSGGGLSTPEKDTRDPNKLGEIVFKNFPAIKAVDGLYQDPTLRGISVPNVVATSDITPAKMEMQRPVKQDIKQEGDKYELHFHGVDMRDAKNIASIVRQELEKIKRETDTRRRSLLTDIG